MKDQELDIKSGDEESSGKPTEILEGDNSEKYLIFSILGRLYSFPSRLISGLAVFDTVYPLPLMPAYVPGVINRYSIPYALFDIGLLLFKTPSPRNKVLILKDAIDRIAFIIDDVSGIIDVSREMLLSMERNAESADLTDTISATFNWNDSHVLVLDIQRILARAAEEAV